jgi:hypothetical protein
MGADAGLWLAIGSAPFLAGAVAVVALCRMAMRRGAQIDGEVRAPLLRLRLHVRPLAVVEAEAWQRGLEAEPRGENVPAARTRPFDERK